MSAPPDADYRPASLQALQGKTALVTGGTRGIGRGVAVALAAAGAQVVITGRDQGAADAVLEQMAELGSTGGFVQADLFDDAAVGGLVAEVIGQHGKLDILVNNAGIDIKERALDYELEAWRAVMRMDLEVPFRLAQAAARHFVDRGGGVIVNIASIMSFAGLSHACAYTAAKHGVAGLTRALAVEWARKGIRVNAVAPGLIQTEMSKVTWGGERGPGAIAALPVKRIGQPRDIGGAVVFLASDAADFIHGETLVVDGGFLA